MSFTLNDIPIYLMIFNIVIAIVLLCYAVYLYRLERKVRSKDRNYDEEAEQALMEANKKALQILTKSEYVSDSIKGEIDQNFDALLETLTKESKDFYEKLKIDSTNYYQKLEKEYETSTLEFTKELEETGKREIDEFAQQIATDATDTKNKFEQVLEDDYMKSHQEVEAYKLQKKQELDNFKIQKQQEFETKLKARIAEIVQNLMPGYINRETQELLVRDAMEKASKEISSQI